MIRADNACLGQRLGPVSLYIRAGDCWHILGENGAGKSSLLQVLAGLETVTGGVVLWQGRPVDEVGLSFLAGQRAWHDQQHVIGFEIPVHQYLSFYADTELPAQISQALELAHLMHRPVTQLSGGEQQRVNLARAFLQVWPALQRGQACLILDEPLQSLDVRHQYSLLMLLQTFNEAGNTLILSSHDLSLSARFAGQAALMSAGQIIASGDKHTVFQADLLARTFGIQFAINNNQNALQITPVWPTV
ncbi:ATP-binding cassette domain-containing protein [Salinimonas lutimaris]|uniref:ATP-binding cassette domain-containing protein n=1 Tax=Salinimonas lutimaris TaxID=914153 RepID=UPI001586C0CA|nr:ATP-binding cassette domain-containing protein [Salinimonas lutimaris]